MTGVRRLVSKAYSRIFRVIERIPKGRVMTYGQVAQAAGLPRGARLVGYALRAADRPLPWQRVVGLRRPGVAHITIKDPIGAELQRRILRREGVKFSESGGIDLGRYGA